MKHIDFDFTPKTVPYPHQLDAINFIQDRSAIALFDEQGLGKSKIVIDALCKDLMHDLIDSAVIVCKKGLINMWKREVSQHSHLQSTVLSGSKHQRGRALMHFNHFYLIGYETMLSEIEKIEMFLKLRRFALVLDESQKIKNPDSKLTQAILSIKDIPVKKVIITGTPIANRPEDLWAQYMFLDGGKTFGVDFKAFKSKYNVNLRDTDSFQEYETSMLRLREKISKTSMRRTKNVLELPEKVYDERIVTLTSKQREIYTIAKDDLFLELSNADNETVRRQIENYLVKLLRLTQIASNPGLLDEGYSEDPAKFSVLDELLNEIVSNNEKAIVWTSFRKNIRTLRRRYKKHGAVMLFGEILIEDRIRAIDKFMNETDIKVLIANPSAAKEGLTLTSANHSIYVDRSFKMDDYLQSQDRIHRIGQEKRCFITKLIAKDTIDEYTDDILEKKHILAQYILGDTSNMETDKQFLSKEDLLRIIG